MPKKTQLDWGSGDLRKEGSHAVDAFFVQEDNDEERDLVRVCWCVVIITHYFYAKEIKGKQGSVLLRGKQGSWYFCTVRASLRQTPVRYRSLRLQHV